MRLLIYAVGLCIFGFVAPCSAHFLWLGSDADGRALVYFGESAADQNYHLPKSLAQLKLFYRSVGGGNPTLVPLSELETDDFVGLRSKDPLARDGLIEARCQYGVYHGTLLIYYAKHILGNDPATWSKLGPAAEHPMDVVPTMGDDGNTLKLTVYVDGKPCPAAEVSCLKANGEPEKQITDADGTAQFKIEEGALSFLVSVTEEGSSGELDGEAYSGRSNYMTLTLTVKTLAKQTQPDSKAADKSHAMHATLPSLPVAISSFGAAVADGYIYVYGGHIGEAHDHSRDNLSQRFVRMRVTETSEWEELPLDKPLQGLALAAHAGAIYRVGGMSAKNGPQEDDDLHSTAEFARFDPATKTWKQLTPLPAARSSHDAVVIGDKLYVVGGWTLSGDGDGDWLNEALEIDLSQDPLTWNALPQQPFQRRALAIGQLQGKLVVIGGIDSDGDISRRVDVYDPATRTWSLTSELPGEGMNGFGVSAWNLGGALYVSGSSGVVYRLTAVDGTWEAVANLDRPRFFHRLLPSSTAERALLAIAGANNSGHLDDVEIVEIVSPELH